MNKLRPLLSSIYKTADRARLWQRFLAGFFLILLGAALRVWPLGGLEARVPWLTFYPMVMIAALFGGIYVGLFCTFIACVIINYFWQLLSPVPFIKDGFDWLGMAVFFFNGAMISFVAEAMRHAQTRAKKAKEISEAANKAKSIFLANMSHELRTPLNAILGFTQVLKKSAETTARQKENLEIISRSGQHLLHLINNVLDISKIESGRVILEERETELYQILSEVKSSMHVKAVEKDLKFMVDIHPGVPHAIFVDGVKLKQVLYNLVGNAIKYTKQGSVVLSVSSNRIDKERKLIKFEVADTGPGIKMEDRENVFQSFVQLKDRLHSEMGTGLGLTISKQYVDLMGGHIGVGGEYGKGTVLYFEIPVTEITTEIKKEFSETHEIIGIEKANNRYLVLIADDQLENRLLLHELLEPYGIELRDAVNGRQAVDIYEDWKPGLIFMDIRMPDINGMEATKIIREKEGGNLVKIIALTAHALEEERIEILNSGCDDLIRKPYQDYEIYEALSKHLAVKFIYSNDISIPSKHKEELSEQALRNLPTEIRRELYHAIELLDDKMALTSIEKIKKNDPELGDKLSDMIAKIRHKEILSLLDLIREEK
jgi:signal transduction histidine kinase/CheY-like chemotaxis protein